MNDVTKATDQQPKKRQRPKRVQMGENVKEMVKISNRQVSIARANLARKASVLMDRVYKSAMGEVEMTAQQLKAAELVLRKIIPDLSNITIQEDRNSDKLTKSELLFKLHGILNANPELQKLVPKLLQSPLQTIQEAEVIEGECVEREKRLN